MCGSGGGFWHPPRSIGPIRRDIDDRTSEADYTAEVSTVIQDALKDFNERDVEAIQKHLQLLRKALSKDIDDVVETSFGGSVAKHSYVDGLSDVDILVNVADTELSQTSPGELLSYFAKLLRDRLPDTKVREGDLAVTVTYSDGFEVQLLPTLKSEEGIRLPDRGGAAWSKVVRPHDFARKLTDVNNAAGRLVVPVIKLMKAAQSSFPADAQLSGYHVESLAVNAFRDYRGRLNAKEMLQHLCRYVETHVQTPVSDSTGQSVHVDDDLGPANSPSRQRISSYVSRLVNKLRSADERRDAAVWEEVLSE
jgi:predicted nucleotidyltransferase